jgi:tetratricopeptide (TPR) repeat protein
MRRRTAWIMKSLPVVLLLGGTATAAVPLPRNNESWHTTDLEGFLIYSDASSSELNALATNLTRMRDAFAAISQIEVRTTQPIKVFLFEDTKEFAPYRDTLLGRPGRSIAGVFIRGPADTDFIILDGQRREAGQSIAYHELTHFFVANSTLRVPLWFNEGLAEFYSSFEVVGNRVKIGRPLIDNLQILRTRGTIPLRRLFAVTLDSPEYTETGHAGVFYAQSWALVHYLLVGSQPRHAQLAAFLAALGRQTPVEEAFRAAFGCDFATFENEIGTYLAREMLPYRIVELAGAHKASAPTSVTLPRDELLFQLGALLAQCRACDLADARRFLAEALKLNPTHTAASALLGLLSNSPDGLATLRSRQVATTTPPLPEPPPSDTAVAEGIVFRLLGRPAPWSDEDRAELQRARRLFEAEIVREPTSTRAYNGLAETYTFSGEDVDVAISSYEKSLIVDPKQGAVVKNVVHLCVNHGQRTRAVALIDRVASADANPEIHRECQDILAIADADEAQRLVGDGQVEEALVVLQRGLGTAANPELRGRLNDEVSRIRGRLERTRQVDLFNSAAAKAHEGDLVGAYRVVERLLEGATDAEVIERAKRLKEELLPYVTNVSPKP